MVEVMLLNVARWLKTRPVHNRLVYNVHDASAPCETLFDAARHLVYAGICTRTHTHTHTLAHTHTHTHGVTARETL